MIEMRKHGAFDVTVIVGSENPVKVQAVNAAFQNIFPDKIIGLAKMDCSTLGLPEQPRGWGTLHSAVSRAVIAKSNADACDYAVGIEGGIEFDGGKVFSRDWVVIYDGRVMGIASTPSFLIPESIADKLKMGWSLGKASGAFFDKKNVGSTTGLIGLLTDGKLDRAELTREAVELAFLRFQHPEWYE